MTITILKKEKKNYLFRTTADRLPKKSTRSSCFQKRRTYLNLNEHIWGQWSSVGAVWTTGSDSDTSLFPLWSGRMLLCDQPDRTLSLIARVWKRRARHGLHHTVVPALPLSPYKGWRWKVKEWVANAICGVCNWKCKWERQQQWSALNVRTHTVWAADLWRWRRASCRPFLLRDVWWCFQPCSGPAEIRRTRV